MGCLFTGKSQRFFLNKGAFWPEISALGVFLNFDNERMPPPPPGCLMLLEIPLLAHVTSNNTTMNMHTSDIGDAITSKGISILIRAVITLLN